VRKQRRRLAYGIPVLTRKHVDERAHHFLRDGRRGAPSVDPLVSNDKSGPTVAELHPASPEGTDTPLLPT